MHQPAEILKKYWGFDTFRPLQEDVIKAVLAKEDALALMPTGGGKSICFQVPALCRPGICLVVSPLIALMKDQVQNLKKRGIMAEAIYSGMHFREIDRILDNCIYGEIKFLYLSPERLANELAQERIRQMNINLLAVDEAHCISQWGYDFRPSYLQIAEIRELLGEVPVLALTATATKEVVGDIQDKLAFKKPNVFSTSFSRKNLAYVVQNVENKIPKLLSVLKNVKGSSVVYVRNRKRTKEIAKVLLNNRIKADFYHAGLTNELREKRQEAWVKGHIQAIVCTNAFGMGIDKPDVRSVVHMDLPESLEAYFQEAGRAGRDGGKAYAVLLYALADKATLERNFENAYPPMQYVRKVYRSLGSYFQLALGSGENRAFDFDIVDFCKNFELEILKTFASLKLLEQEGYLVLTEAVFIPSTFKVLLNREQLYDYQLKNRGMDPVIKTLLRVTEGAFQQHAKINEFAIARFLKMPVDRLLRAIEQLHKDRIIDYRSAKDKPQLIFTNERIDADNLTIDMEQYNFRKDRQKERMQKAIAYASTQKCRSQQLLAYFDEKSLPCGVCDVCLENRGKTMAKDDYERYQSKIQQLLRREQLTENELMESFSSNRHANVLEVLNYLLDEGLVERKEDKLIWKIS